MDIACEVIWIYNCLSFNSHPTTNPTPHFPGRFSPIRSLKLFSQPSMTARETALVATKPYHFPTHLHPSALSIRILTLSNPPFDPPIRIVMRVKKHTQFVPVCPPQCRDRRSIARSAQTPDRCDGTLNGPAPSPCTSRPESPFRDFMEIVGVKEQQERLC
jgi:hypothetical protein